MSVLKINFITRFFQKRKLQTDILITFFTLLFISVNFEIFYSTGANKQIILQFEKEHYSKKISAMTANWLDSYFNQVGLVVSILSKNKIDDENLTKFTDFEDLFKIALKKTPFTLTFQVALDDGSLLQVRNTRGLTSFLANSTTPLPSYAAYAVRKMEHSPEGDNMTETWKYMCEDYTPIVKEALPFAQYDPRERDWYIATATNKKLLWSEPYILKTSKTFGITVSSPILKDGQKGVQGVIAVDFLLSDFGDLLNGIRTTRHASVRLINEKNEILASTRTDEKAVPQDGSSSKLMKVTESNDEILQIAAKNLIGTNETHVAYEIRDGRAYVASKQKLSCVPFSIFTITPQSDFTDEFDTLRFNMFLMAFFVFLFLAVVVFWFSRRISQPIAQLCRSATAIGKMDLEHYSEPPKSSIFEIKKLSSAIDVMKASIVAFSKYTPKGIVSEVLKSGKDTSIGGMTKEITIFFSDIEKFSTISEKLPAEYLISHLSEYFDELTQNIMEHNGTIDKYIGDAIMAVWGALNPDENQVINACNAALNCQQILEKLKEKWVSLGKPPLPTRIGLHSGSATVGNIGSQDRMNFTAIGSAVDIASSLEGANKVYGTWILASEAIESKAHDKILFRVIDKVAFTGIKAGITIFEPICSLKSANDTYYKTLELCSKSKEAFELYQSQNFKDALELYTEISKTFPDKAKPTKVLIKRCEEFVENPPKNWDGIYRLS